MPLLPPFLLPLNSAAAVVVAIILQLCSMATEHELAPTRMEAASGAPGLIYQQENTIAARYYLGPAPIGRDSLFRLHPIG